MHGNDINKLKTSLLFWFVIDILFKVLDIASTVYIVKQQGIDAESNPVVYYGLQHCGLWPTMISIFIVYTGVCWILYHKMRKDLLQVVAIIMIMIVSMNVTTIAIQ